MLAVRLACCALALACLAPGAASAADGKAPADVRAAARAKAEEGFKLYGADRWAEALERFREADQLFHAPTLVVYAARCQRKLGKLVEARALYEKVVAEPLAKDAPAEFVEGQADAKRELDDLRGRIPSIQIVIEGVPAETARAAIDGVPAPVIRERIEIDPGTHVIDAISERAKRVERRSITVAEGSAEKVEIALEPLAQAEPAPAAPPADAPAPPVKKGSAVPGAVVVGVGAASLGVGVLTGALSLAKVSDIKAQCQGNTCPATLQSRADSARLLGNVSTAALVVGGVAAVTGVVLLVVRPGGHTSSPQGAASAFSWHAGLGLGRLDVGGTF
jgi:tetratricopeptide (TPR) repeat protein